MRGTLLFRAGLVVLSGALAGVAQAQSAPPSAPPPTSSAGSDTAGKDETAIAKETENPIADLISVPFNNYST